MDLLLKIGRLLWQAVYLILAPYFVANFIFLAITKAVYTPIHDYFEGDEFKIYVYGGNTILFLWFWIFNSFFIYIDLTNPEWVQKYKIQEDKKPSRSQYFAVFKTILFNQLLVGPVVTAFWYNVASWSGTSFSTEELPSIIEVVAKIAFCIIFEEIGFYYTHRSFHHPALYFVHKKHHEWKAPVSITSIYAHPIEHAVSNLSPVLLGSILTGSHVTTLWIWATIAMFETTCSHSGYHFPYMPSPESHDYHHKVSNECFGLGILDRIHGTDATFRKSVEGRRAYTSFSTTPVRTLHPE